MAHPLSQYVTLEEAIKSPTAIRLGINNMPGANELAAMQRVATLVFDPIRRNFGRPLKVSSFYRCPELNRAVKGAANSQHMLGEAVDIDGDPSGVSNSQIFAWVRKNLSFDQLIWEYGDNNDPAWVHVSYTNGHPLRQEVLRVTRTGTFRIN